MAVKLYKESPKPNKKNPNLTVYKIDRKGSNSNQTMEKIVCGLTVVVTVFGILGIAKGIEKRQPKAATIVIQTQMDDAVAPHNSISPVFDENRNIVDVNVNPHYEEAPRYMQKKLTK